MYKMRFVLNEPTGLQLVFQKNNIVVFVRRGVILHLYISPDYTQNGQKIKSPPRR